MKLLIPLSALAVKDIICIFSRMIENAGEKNERFMQLYDPAHARLARFIQSVVWNRDDARDILGETVLRAYENFEKIRNHGAFVFYLFGIAARIIKHRERHKKFWGIYNPAAAENIPDEAGNPVAVTEWNEFRNALNYLPVKQREAIVLFEVSGFSLNEIRQIQGGSLSGVKSRLGRARIELTKKLEYKVTLSKNKLADEPAENYELWKKINI